MSSVTVTAADPDFPGNSITAFDSLGNQIDQKAFVGDDTPGVLTYDPQTVTGRIRSIRLDAPIGEYIYYLPFQVTIAGPPPTIASISPSPLVPGATATIVGTDFNAIAGSNVVSIGGQTATITGGSTTALSIVVPCTSGGTVPVTVSDGSQTSAPVAHPLQVTQRLLQTGESIVLGSAESACNELPVVTNATPRYVLSVVNVNEDPTNSVPVQVSANFLGGGVPVAARRDAIAGGRSIIELIGERAAAVRMGAHMARLASNRRSYERLRGHFQAPSGGAALAVGAAAAAVVAPPATKLFRMEVDNGDCNAYWVVSAKRVFSSGKIAIYEDVATDPFFKAAANATVSADYTKLGNEFNATMEPLITANYGNILLRDAATDNNGVVLVLFTPKIRTTTPQADAYVSACDQAPNSGTKTRAVGGVYTDTVSSNGASNFGEVIFAKQPKDRGTAYSGETVNQWYRSIRTIVVHESKHVAALSARASINAPTAEEDWLEEGLAVTAEELWMRKVDKITSSKQNIGYGSASNPINVFCDLSVIAPCATAPRPASIMYERFANMYTALANPGRYSVFGPTSTDATKEFYGEAWSLIRYAADRSGRTDADFFSMVTKSASTGVANLTAAAGIPIDQLLGGRALSMYADDFPALTTTTPAITFPSWNLRDIFGGMNRDVGAQFPQPFPLIPTPLTFGAAAAPAPAVLAGGTTAWYELTGTQNTPQLLRLQGSGGASLPPDLRLAIARLK